MIPETVADKVETQDRYGDGYSGVYDQPPGRREHTLKGGAHHAAPRGVRRGYSHPQEAQGRLRKDSAPKVYRGNYHHGGEALRRHVAHNDAPRGSADRSGAVHVGHLRD